ncbi:uncharacterized protein LOC123451882 isoform X2 [Hordeum vulgare subsp. vulgare]|uniref:uncharacterized protein LOC123451882 isoform X2 n=1 Tax=Hordeum vulgare subsp. vulgare TaxID=112509 RepID=UPI001D1A4F0A|nr:uncharacterized protein LOC123451882 isoform X2 [Hordeum vulgare subsp. vulgare]
MVAVAAAEAGGDWQECPVKEAVHVEEGALELTWAFDVFDVGPFDMFYEAPSCVFYEAPSCVFYTCAPSELRTDTKYNARTGNKLSPLVVRNGELFGAREMNMSEGGPWLSPRTDPPTNVKF